MGENDGNDLDEDAKKLTKESSVKSKGQDEDQEDLGKEDKASSGLGSMSI